MSRAKELNNYLAAYADDEDNVRPPLALADFCRCGHHKGAHIYEEGACRPGFVCGAECEKYVSVTPPKPKLDPRLEARAVEMVAAGWIVYKLEVTGDEPVRPSEIINQAQKARGCGHE